ncbi:DUF2795 domain-containing protein [Dactylosporangium matsuzakiense]|uniref:DUF2795 domain-containing protein n=1 Tax=Dactylosporangium matsuzakiense TaxID=53360 RepID=A0A9W6NLW4_9ACTN|nr:DUF2795 domain-containing protein [Dactylosporangium matsuzakiense]UWZ46810.1 DUF2795 domain-containing protein [Dactylosporangium matsuzakiense]GLL01784.1 hypothetical protein GCM10017581_035260 [Dactylosporangium matsuzakiense]
MERGNTKHGVALDDRLRREAEYEVRQVDPEGEGDRSGGAPFGMTPDDVEARSNLGRYIPKSSLPGDRDDLIAGATELDAPDEVLDALEVLPPATQFETVNQVWAALGGRNEDPAHRP